MSKNWCSQYQSHAMLLPRENAPREMPRHSSAKELLVTRQVQVLNRDARCTASGYVALPGDVCGAAMNNYGNGIRCARRGRERGGARASWRLRSLRHRACDLYLQVSYTRCRPAEGGRWSQKQTPSCGGHGGPARRGGHPLHGYSRRTPLGGRNIGRE
jgi:hypothetical protein